MSTLLNNEESQKYLQEFYESKFADKYPSFYDFISGLVLVSDKNQSHEDWSEEHDEELRLLGAVWIESTAEGTPVEDDWNETVIQLNRRYFKFGWRTYETSPWPEYELTLPDVLQTIREVVPVQKIITVYE